MSEANIEINGVRLSIAQAMTLRVAISSFVMSMQDDGLGDSEHGKAMAEAYIRNASEIELLLVGR